MFVCFVTTFSPLPVFTIAALIRMLTSDQENQQGAYAQLSVAQPQLMKHPLVWKILIYDKKSKDVLSLLLKVGELRKMGVTLEL